MRVLIQRVSEASVKIDGVEISNISKGLLVFVGIENDDSDKDIEYLSKKIANLRIFDDANGVMNDSVLEVKGEIMVISQFTLQACTKKGNRPSYIKAAKPDVSIPLYEKFCNQLQKVSGVKIKTGEFGADMKVSLTNDGPVTIWIDSKTK
ncbi:MAG: D-aminoacyl-tRNA deacylase [Dysgonamonadaceae bacterium]|nr:D-aminoacyl-tRNA deacylase [Dysgonamonadaceae bacterium]MDD4247376.1 D-aminoacyl-tRNA deacylase [Dysgonamonadaceae bacterium]HUI32956.1 D-aminoacyl-tRNA deacylase [Dysgonamonadaceae bacterium]